MVSCRACPRERVGKCVNVVVVWVSCPGNTHSSAFVTSSRDIRTLRLSVCEVSTWHGTGQNLTEWGRHSRTFLWRRWCLLNTGTIAGHSAVQRDIWGPWIGAYLSLACSVAALRNLSPNLGNLRHVFHLLEIGNSPERSVTFWWGMSSYEHGYIRRLIPWIPWKIFRWKGHQRFESGNKCQELASVWHNSW